jgi:hypothetical protein
VDVALVTGGMQSPSQQHPGSQAYGVKSHIQFAVKFLDVLELAGTESQLIEYVSSVLAPVCQARAPASTSASWAFIVASCKWEAVSSATHVT